MKRIDRDTAQRIIDAADIVEVVSDFVNLKRRGANYIGLCPFHEDRTPSFSVSKSKNICKCFACGKGGSPVNFIMEHEHMTYNEALRYLAKKYHIEVQEHEMTDQEKEQASEREALMAVNDFALEHFSHTLSDTEDGRDIGRTYFYERGINDQMIERFHLGYALDKFDDFYTKALARGFEEKHLLATGLCGRSEQKGTIYDRFRGRVIYPWFSLSGRVVAFGGRILRSEKSPAKYVNSPESVIYSKSREVYGLYQAKNAISQKKKCILVEGYMDVISMYQSGIENVVASSGTALTEGQIRLIHRFTENVTVIYDSDAAGIKASLRGIDLLLAEGMNVKVLLLPDGEDPDSYAQSHSSQEVLDYIAQNETDFIRFKTRILLDDAKDDPIARARVINDIIRSIAVIPDPILRAEYVKECSRMLDVNETTLTLQLQKVINDNLLRKGQAPQTQQPEMVQPVQVQGSPQPPHKPLSEVRRSEKMVEYERELIKYVVKYGLASLPTAEGEEPISVLDYVTYELEADSIVLSDPILGRILQEARDIAYNRWPEDKAAYEQRLGSEMAAALESGREEIRRTADGLAEIQERDRLLTRQCTDTFNQRMDDHTVSYIENILLSSQDDDVRRVATDLAFEKYTLSKVHTKYAHIETERERLGEIVPRAVLELKLGILNEKIVKVNEQLKARASDPEAVVALMQEQKALFAIRSQFSKYLGERIVTPPQA